MGQQCYDLHHQTHSGGVPCWKCDPIVSVAMPICLRILSVPIFVRLNAHFAPRVRKGIWMACAPIVVEYCACDRAARHICGRNIPPRMNGCTILIATHKTIDIASFALTGRCLVSCKYGFHSVNDYECVERASPAFKCLASSINCCACANTSNKL